MARSTTRKIRSKIHVYAPVKKPMRHGQGSVEALERVEFIPSRPEAVERAPDHVPGRGQAAEDTPIVNHDLPPPPADSSRVRICAIDLFATLPYPIQ